MNTNRSAPFRDRVDAGQRLAALLARAEDVHHKLHAALASVTASPAAERANAAL